MISEQIAAQLEQLRAENEELRRSLARMENAHLVVMLERAALFEKVYGKNTHPDALQPSAVF